MTAPHQEWFANILAILNTRSGQTLLAAIALAGVISLIILYVPCRVAEVYLAPIRRDLDGWGGWIFIGTLVSVSFVVVRWVRRSWNRRKNGLARKKTEAQTLAHLDTLPDDERGVLCQCVCRGHNSFTADSLGGYRSIRNEVLNRLAAKRLVVLVDWRGSVYMIPPFVWAELKRRC